MTDAGFTPIQLNMRRDIERIRESNAHQASSHAFASLFLWQSAMQLSIDLKDSAFLVRSRIFGENAYFFPCGDQHSTRCLIANLLHGAGDGTAMDSMSDPPLTFLYLQRQDALLLEESFPGCFEVEEDRASFEYLYDREEYLKLNGKKFHHVRNDLNKLKSEHEVTFAPLDESLMGAAFDIVRTWNRERQEEKRPHRLMDDEETSLFLLQHFEEMGAFGRVALLDGVPAGVLAGSRITHDTFDLQMTKMKTPVRGLMYAMLMDLFESLPKEISLINREEDLGIPGLRSFKEGLNPCGYNEMYIARLRAKRGTENRQYAEKG